jgi:formylglycine-generating enzyme required for sulfatase activity
MLPFVRFMRSHAALTASALVALGVIVLAVRLESTARQEATARITNSIGIQFVRIPAGSFLMGSPKTEEGRYDDEEQHEVKLTKAFHLGAFEVTQAQYEKIMGANPSHFSAKGEGKARVKDQNTSKFPVEQVSWTQAKEFCKKLSDQPAEKKAGRVYRLASEAEWEYACRAGTKTPVHYGGSLNIQANFCGLAPYPLRGKRGYDEGNTRDIGCYDANAFGLFDMHGNVHEWCEDWYGPYASAKQVDPRGPETGKERVFRGGCWLSTGRACRSAQRAKLGPDETHFGVGFRVVMEIR